jgi:hypothetical protein
MRKQKLEIEIHMGTGLDLRGSIWGATLGPPENRNRIHRFY